MSEIFGDSTCLTDLADGIQEKLVVIRLFLQDDRERDEFYLKIPEGYFPHIFRMHV